MGEVKTYTVAFGLALVALGSAGNADSCTRPSETQIIFDVLGSFLEERPEIMWTSSADGLTSYRLRKFDSVDDFLTSNPNCCDVLATGPEGLVPNADLAHQIDFAGSVRIAYKLEYFIHEKLVSVSVADTYLAINSCGERIRFSFDNDD